MKSLVIRFSSLGDIILTTPVVAALAAHDPECEIHYATKEEYRTLLGHFPVPVRTLLYAGTTHHDFLDYARQCARQSYDLVFDLHANMRSHTLTSKLATRAVYTYPNDFWRRLSLVWLKRGFSASRSVVDRYLAAVEKAGISPVSRVPSLQVSPADRTTAADRLAELGWTIGTKTIGIGWGARWETKQVPVQLWDRLLKQVHSDNNISFILFGTEADRVGMETFCLERPQLDIIPFCGEALSHVLGVLSWCTGLVTSDSGLMHAGSALDVPTWGIFGPTHPALGFAPVGPHAHAVHSGIFCSPCSRHGKRSCYRGHRFCFDQINWPVLAEEVTAAVQDQPASSSDGQPGGDTPRIHT